MSRHERFQRLFTAEQATAMLPLVRAITADLVETSRDVLDRRQRVATLLAGRDLEDGDPYSAELAHIQSCLQADLQRVQGYIDELTELGVEARSATEGLVDFPSLMDGRMVYLCWKLGEADVGHWHEVDAGYAGRKPLRGDCVAHRGADDRGGSLLA